MAALRARSSSRTRGSYKLNKKKIRFFIFGIWICAAVLAAPILYYRQQKYWTVRLKIYENQSYVPEVEFIYCQEVWVDNKARAIYTWCTCFLTFLGPCFVIITCYCSVGIRISRLSSQRSHRVEFNRNRNKCQYQDIGGSATGTKTTAALVTSNTTILTCTAIKHAVSALTITNPNNPPLKIQRSESIAIVPDNQISHNDKNITFQNQLHNKTSRKALKIIVVLVAMFCFCWFPINIINIVLDILLVMRNPKIEQVSKLLPYFYFLGHLHSSISPICYWILNKPFQRYLNHICLCFCHCKERKELKKEMSDRQKNRSVVRRKQFYIDSTPTDSYIRRLRVAGLT